MQKGLYLEAGYDLLIVLRADVGEFDGLGGREYPIYSLLMESQRDEHVKGNILPRALRH